MVSWLGFTSTVLSISTPVTMKGLVCPFWREWPLELARSVLTVTSMPEIVGDAGILLPPDDLERWVHALESVVSETEKRISLKEEALKRSTSFQWEQSIMQTLSLYEKATR